MTYNHLLILLPIIFIAFAIYKQKSLKGKFTNFSFYGDESLQIAKTIIPSNQEITFISCGTNLDTQNQAMFKASGMYNITNTSTGDFKYFDYYIFAKTTSKIYFIPVKIDGKWKLTLKVNEKMNTEIYDIENVKHEILEDKPNATLPTMNVKFEIGKNTSHNVQFYDNFENFK